jgi:hypothetical protein
MRHLLAIVLWSALSLLARGEGRPIPQNPEQQQQRYRDSLAWNQRTLLAAYEKVGKKSPRWDKPARAALEAAALHLSHSIDPVVKVEEVFIEAKRAVDAGCDDPLILYLYARASYGANYPGLEELERRFKTAAVALEGSTYPPLRRVTALQKAAQAHFGHKELSAEDRSEGNRWLDASLALFPKAAESYGKSLDEDHLWLEKCRAAITGYRKLSGDYESAYKRVDTVLAKTPALKPLRLLVKGDFHIHFAWDARGNGFANTVTEEGWKKFGDRLAVARSALEEAWKLKPSAPEAATLMLMVEKGAGGDRAEMEKWFERAMKANPNNVEACELKMDWLDPKWHGSREEVLAFGRACRATHNWRVGITLLAADGHWRVAQRMDGQDQRKYYRTPAVSDEIKAVYEEFLEHYPDNDAKRSFYAAYCYMCGRYAEADKQFKRVGERLVWNTFFPQEFMKQARDFVAQHPVDEPSEAPKK